MGVGEWITQPSCADSKGKGMGASHQVSLGWAQEVRRKRRNSRKRGKRKGGVANGRECLTRKRRGEGCRERH